MVAAPPIFAAVLRSGGCYDWKYVERLFNGIRRHAPKRRFEGIVLTDMPGPDIPDVTTIPLFYNWPGWWSKLELFRPHLFDERNLLYFDLDTIIVGDLSDIIAVNQRTLLRDFYRDQAQSGVMMLTERSDVWHQFAPHAKAYMKDFSGDGQFLNSSIGSRVKLWQDVLPGQIVSYKPNGCNGEHLSEVPPGARVVCFHGEPKPHNADVAWVKQAWGWG